MVDQRRERDGSNDQTDEADQHRSVSITEASDGFVVDVEVDWDTSAEGEAAEPGTESGESPPGSGLASGTEPEADSGQSEEEGRLSKVLIVDGNDTRGDATYTVTVSGEIRADGDASSDADAVEQPGPSTNGRVVGILTDGMHVYRYSGTIEELSVDGNVDVRFGGASE